MNMRTISAGLSAAALALTLTACGGSSGPEAPEDPRVDETEARLQCERIVENNLRSPGTADFAPNREVTYTEVGTEGLQVNGWVDAENAFGGTIRNDYQCTVEPAAEEGTFSVNLDYLEGR